MVYKLKLSIQTTNTMPSPRVRNYEGYYYRDDEYEVFERDGCYVYITLYSSGNSYMLRRNRADNTYIIINTNNPTFYPTQ